MTTPITAIVLAAGAGSRMKSDRAKVLHELGGRSMIAHALTAVRSLHPDRSIVVIGHQREQIVEHVDAHGFDVEYAVQEDQRGTGHAVRVAIDTLDRPPEGTVLVTYGDVPLLTAPTLASLVHDHVEAQSAVTILSSDVDDPAGYGRIVRDRAGNVVAIREDADATGTVRAIREINSGILAIDARFLSGALPRLDDDNAQGELYLTDIVALAVRDGHRVGAHVLPDRWQTEGVNDRKQLARLGAELNRRICDQLMLDGVTIIDPGTTWIDAAVRVGRDTTLLPGTQLLGSTEVGRNATVGPDTTLRDTQVLDGATVVRTHALEAKIGPGATIGPFCYLRPGTDLGDGSKVGTFVETKNARLDSGAKVPHLSYVGDAQIGTGTNIGAGTIFANYDGIAKHRTTVGKHARTGSDNVFVAPVEIGDGAYTAAGTTVRKNVPPGALARSESPQVTIEGWVQDNRPGTAASDAAREARNPGD